MMNDELNANLRKIEGIFLRLSSNSAFIYLSKPPSGLLRFAQITNLFFKRYLRWNFLIISHGF